MFSQQISGNPQQPGPDQGGRIETSLRQIEPQKNFLSHIIGVARLLQSGSKIPIDGSLIAFDHERERISVSAAELLDQRLI
jgi:hypothetical protein